MKNKRLFQSASALALSLLLSGGLALSTHAAAPSEATMELRPGVSIQVDGTSRNFYNAQGAEVHPVFYNGTHYLPVRAIGELMGKNVNWSEPTRTITLAGTRSGGAVQGREDTAAVTRTIQAQLRPDFTIVVDDSVRTFRDEQGNVVSPVLYEGTTYLPVRAIGELMGKAVNWDAGNLLISLSTRSGDNLVTDADSFNPTPAVPATPAPSVPTPSTGTLIGEAEARRIALQHAGLSESDVTFVRAYLDWDDGRQVYDVEFYQLSGSVAKEYDYEIDAVSGQIRDVDYDAEYYRAPAAPSAAPSTPAGTISAQQAKEIVLARVPGATLNHIRDFEQDYDNGRLRYEGKIVYQNMEYEFEVDGSSGAIRSWEVESVYD